MRRIHLVALVLLALALGLLGAGCLDGTETTATPETVVGTLPTTRRLGRPPALDLTGDPAAGKAIFASAGCVGCHTLAEPARPAPSARIWTRQSRTTSSS